MRAGSFTSRAAQNLNSGIFRSGSSAGLATPVFRALRAAHPEAEIALEGRPVLEGLLRGLPSFDRFLPDPGGGLGAMLARARVLREPVECSPCQRKTCPIDRRCMTRLAPERAIAAAEELVRSPA